jgi:hypothetical protein
MVRRRKLLKRKKPMARRRSKLIKEKKGKCNTGL